MMDTELIYGRIASALLCDYSKVYYVNATTDEYVSYSLDPGSRTLITSFRGKDFFSDITRDINDEVYKEDRHIFTEDIQKKNLVNMLDNSSMKNIVYRRMIDGNPVYHELRLIRGVSSNDEYFILGVTNIDKEVRTEQKAERLSRETIIYNQIASSLASYYNTIYYVDAEDDTYIEFSANTEYDELDIPKKGSDFFNESRRNILKYIHNDDRDSILEIMRKEYITEKLKDQKIFSMKYRLLLSGEFRYTRLNVMWSSDKTHFIIGVENIDEQMRKELASKELERKNITYSQILNSLAFRYDSIYYVDIQTGAFTHYSSEGENGVPVHENSGTDFFAEMPQIINDLVCDQDKKKVLEAVTRNNLLDRLTTADSFNLTFRKHMKENCPYMSLRVAWAEDKRHVILGSANIDEDVKRENKYKEELITVTRKAMKDELTGVKNKNAYQEEEYALQNDIDNGSTRPFAVLICDLNDLKRINDTLGHKVGDEYICAACKLICGIFVHSPVFRIGGDEFAVILRDNDHDHKDELLTELRRQVMENRQRQSAPVVASGLAEYEPNHHRKVSDVFELADSRMYENKKELKQLAYA